MNNRKRLLIHPEIQLALVRQLLLNWFLFILGTSTIVFMLQFLLDPLQSTEETAIRLQLFGGSMALVAVCMVPWCVYNSIRLSHRIVGPIVRLRSGLRDLTRDGGGRIVLRKADYWHDVTDEFNTMLERLHPPVAAGTANGITSSPAPEAESLGTR